MRAVMIAVALAASSGATPIKAGIQDDTKNDDGCSQITVTMHAIPQNPLHSGPLGEIHDAKRPAIEVVVYEGQPVRVEVGVLRVRFEPPKDGITVRLLQDARLVSTIHFDRLTRHTTNVMQAGTPERMEGVVYASEMRSVTFDPGRGGSYSLEARLEGCDPSGPYFRDPTRLEVRPVSTARDRADLLQYQADEAAVFSNNCKEAVRVAKSVEAIEPEADAPIRIQQYCAEKEGDLETAVRLVERLQGKFEKRGGRERDSAPRLPGCRRECVPQASPSSQRATAGWNTSDVRSAKLRLTHDIRRVEMQRATALNWSFALLGCMAGVGQSPEPRCISRKP